MIDRKLRIGTRGSKMALMQANQVGCALQAAYPDLKIDITVIETSGDWKPEHGETSLSEADGGKGLFAKEIEQELLGKKIDIAVHSVKDMSSFLPAGLSMHHYLKRDTPCDALVSHVYTSFEDLPQGATIGSASVRRKAALLHKRPDLNIVNIRGNVTTRIKKMLAGSVDALILSASGLERIEQTSFIQHIFSIEEMLPACGQGTIGIEFRTEDTDICDLLAPIHDFETGLCLSAERAALRALNGSCRTPIGAYAVIEGGLMSLTVTVLRLDGTKLWTETATQKIDEDIKADQFGFKLGLKLKDMVEPDIISDPIRLSC